MSLIIRSAVPEDAEELLSIYRYYVEHTAISFECEAPSAEVFRERIENTLKKYPYLVAVKEGKVVGYSYAGAFRPRQAYDHCCELTVYLDRNERHGGIGRKLYEAMEEKLADMGMELSYACIGVPAAEADAYLDTNSRDFHAHMGYREIGHFHLCGKKFGNYYDMIYMEKRLHPNKKKR